MKVLLDNNFPLPFRHELKTCEVETAAYRGWEALGDDELLRRAEAAFSVLVTLDTSLADQQNVSSHEIGIIVLDVHPIILPNLKQHAGMVESMVWTAAANSEAIRILDRTSDPIVEPIGR